MSMMGVLKIIRGKSSFVFRGINAVSVREVEISRRRTGMSQIGNDKSTTFILGWRKLLRWSTVLFEGFPQLRTKLEIFFFIEVHRILREMNCL